jgi:hypothetical protein
MLSKQRQTTNSLIKAANKFSNFRKSEACPWGTWYPRIFYEGSFCRIHNLTSQVMSTYSLLLHYTILHCTPPVSTTLCLNQCDPTRGHVNPRARMENSLTRMLYSYQYTIGFPQGWQGGVFSKRVEVFFE